MRIEAAKTFNEIKKALTDATALAQPDIEGKFVLDIDAIAVARALWERRLRSIVVRSKKLIATKTKYGASKLDLYAAHHSIVNNYSYQ